MTSTSPHVLAIDIGGTWTRAGIVVDGVLGFTDRVRTDTQDRDLFVGNLLALVERVRAHDPAVGAIGVSAAGPLDPRTGTFYSPPNVSNSVGGLGLGAILREATGLPVHMDRDTNCALLGEARQGAARGASFAVFATFSTGVGAAVLLNGQRMDGRDGVAGELGHVRVVPDGPACGCGRRGCLEAVASGTGIAAAAGQPSGLAAQEVAACVDWANAFNPEVIVIGGAVARTHPAWIEAANRAVATQAMAPARGNCPVVLGELGDEVGLYGAAALALLG